MDKLLDNIVRFQNEIYPQQKHLLQQLAASQSPETLFIACSDSRVVPNQLLQTQPGELFICRNAGNIVPPHGDVIGGVSATVEYAVQLLGVKHIVVCGHSDCGAMTAVLHPEKVAKHRAVAKWLRHAERVLAVVREMHPDLDDAATLDLLIEENVSTQIHNLLTHPSVAAKVKSGYLQVHGLVFDIPCGQFKMLDKATDTFVPVADLLAARRNAEVANA